MAILTNEQARNVLAMIAEAEIGVREQGGNNRGKRVVEYQSATWLEPGPWAWCAAFVCWCIRKWLEAPSVRECLYLTEAHAAEWRPQTAGAFDFARWASNKGLHIVGENEPVRRGDLVIYDFSHIGIVTEDSERGEIAVIEGNTNGRGERDSESGDGVWRKFRARSLAKQFIRILP